MVYYFTSNVVDPPAFIYVGKDKFENEELIKYGWEDDVCLLHQSDPDCPPQFHVDKLSSAHVYLRLPDPVAPDGWTSIPPDLVADLAQLTKANSIDGNRRDNVTVIYTPWSNLLKDGSMADGQVAFRDARMVRRVLVAKRENAIVNRLVKTRVENVKPDLRQEREDRLRELRARDRAEQQAKKKEADRLAKEWADQKHQKDHAYDAVFTEENLAESSNQDRGEDWEDDFM